jgi:hypothetical protein
VERIGEIMVDEMGLRDMRFELKGRVDGGRDWMATSRRKELSVDKMLRWVDANVSGEEPVRSAAVEMPRYTTHLK